MMKTALATALLVGAITMPAYADRYSPLSGERLLQTCSGSNETLVSGCQAYIDGVSDAITSYQASRPADGRKGQPLEAYVCVPGRLTGPQLREAFVTWARQHQDELRAQASAAVIRALLTTFPCEQRR